MIHGFDFTWVDYAVLGMIAVSMLISFFRGFVREAVSLAIWIVAVIAALKFAAPVGDLFQAHMASASMRFAVAFIAIFLVIIIIGMIINAIVRMLIDKTGLSIIDRLLGLIFGFARGVLLIAMVLMFVNMSALAKNQDIKKSWAVQTMQPLVAWLDGFVPEHVSKVSAWINNDMDTQSSTTEHV